MLRDCRRMALGYLELIRGHQILAGAPDMENVNGFVANSKKNAVLQTMRRLEEALSDFFFVIRVFWRKPPKRVLEKRLDHCLICYQPVKCPPPNCARQCNRNICLGPPWPAPLFQCGMSLAWWQASLLAKPVLGVKKRFGSPPADVRDAFANRRVGFLPRFPLDD